MQTYQFDNFPNHRKHSEIERLTTNVDSHSKALADLLLTNGLYGSNEVLDVGCGTGAMLQLLASLLEKTKFYGVDNSTKILETAKNTIGQTNEKIQFTHGNARNLPYPDNTFDFVFTRLVLMHNSNPEQVIDEMVRVCKPGGTICAIEIDDGTQIFHPHGEELNKIVQAHIQFSKLHGTDRTMGRKLYSLFSKHSHTEETKVIIQTSDYSKDFIQNNELPTLLKFALGNDDGRRLVEANLLTEEDRSELVSTFIPRFLASPHRFESCSFMYAFGKKVAT